MVADRRVRSLICANRSCAALLTAARPREAVIADRATGSAAHRVTRGRATVAAPVQHRATVAVVEVMRPAAAVATTVVEEVADIPAVAVADTRAVAAEEATLAVEVVTRAADIDRSLPARMHQKS